MMSTAKWFVVRKPSRGEIIATSANQIVHLRGTKTLYQAPLSSWRVEGDLLNWLQHIEAAITDIYCIYSLEFWWLSGLPFVTFDLQYPLPLL